MAVFPELIGKYPIESLVAKGGMGAVFKALHPTLKRHVIIKKLTLRGSATITERFKREARILMDFKNDHIVRVFDHFKEGSSHYIVLEYVDGMSLDQLIKRQRSLSSELALVIFLDACRALQYAHGMGVIHRDIKPGNILISRKGEVKLADFGIAASEEEDDSGLTKEGMTLGTPSYMPPEQIENSKNVDRRADIYAMGIMLYEMVTGKKPYPGNFAPETVVLIQKGRYRAAGKVNPRVLPFVDKLIKKLIKPDPRKRFQTMDAVIKTVEKFLSRYSADSLRSVLSDLVSGKCQDEPRYRPAPRKRFLLAAILVLLAGIGAGGWYAWTEGLVHRYLMPDRWGELRLVVRVPKSQAEAADIFLRARIFHNDGKEIPEVEDVRIVLRPAETEGADPFHTFVSNRLFLAPGPYRVKLTADQDLHWESFHLLPYSMAAPGEDGVRVLQFRLEDRPPRPLAVLTEARDALTGTVLGEAVFSAYLRGEWKPLDKLESGDLTSGAVWKLRAEAEGYFPEVFSLRIANAQERLRLEARLAPRPGSLVVETPAGSYRLTLNGLGTAASGGPEMLPLRLGTVKEGRVEWELPASAYELGVARGGASGRASFRLEPGRTVRIRVSDEGGTLRFRVEE
ncbi:MAG TPA: serine/threonine-protein kinase [Spirochaetia bacterium]|nr:serine/threonine-protein kinase [Spirochaetia bacterium]